VYAPPSLVAVLPSDVPLDGELFLGRGRFQECMSIVRRHVPDPLAWSHIRFMVFDAPSAKGTFLERILVATSALKGCGWARSCPKFAVPIVIR
jgi:DNA ligase 1